MSVSIAPAPGRAKEFSSDGQTFENWSELYLFGLLQNAAKQVVDDVKTGPGSRLAKLYASPGEFARLSALAVEAMLVRNVVAFGQPVTRIENGRVAMERVTFSLPVSAIAPPNVIERVKRMAL